jgi:hypothetical protein
VQIVINNLFKVRFNIIPNLSQATPYYRCIQMQFYTHFSKQTAGPVTLYPPLFSRIFTLDMFVYVEKEKKKP